MRKILSLFVLAIFLLVISGCKEEDATVSQGVTDDTITVGNCAVTEGALSVVGVPFNEGIKAYFDMVNEDGGVKGRDIEFVHESDDFFTASVGLACTEKMIHDNEVFALVGHFGTPTVGATVELIKETGIPMVYAATGIGSLYSENSTDKPESVLFPVQPIYKAEGRIMVARAVADLEAQKIGVIYVNDDAGKDFLIGILDQSNKMQGVEVFAESIPVGASDVTAAVTKIMDKDVDVVLVATLQDLFPSIAITLANQGNTADIITSYVSADKTRVNAIVNDVKDESGDYKFDVYANAWVDATKADNVEIFVNQMKAYTGTDDYAANAFSMAGWIAAHFFVEGLKNVEGDDITWDAYIEAMEKAPIENPLGGTIDYTAGKRLGTQELSLLKMNDTEALGWEVFKPIQSIEEITAE